MEGRGRGFELGDFEVEKRGAIRDARPVWPSHGTLDAARYNVAVHPCGYSATHEDLSRLIGPDGRLPARCGVVWDWLHR